MFMVVLTYYEVHDNDGCQQKFFLFDISGGLPPCASQLPFQLQVDLGALVPF